MSHQKSYLCGICKTKPDQISHHKSHIETQRHIDKREIFKLKLASLSNDNLVKSYNTNIIADIVNETETIIFLKNENNIQYISDETKSMSMEEKKEIINSNITNKDALKDKIHEIHNFLRNNGAGYGMNALKVFNII